jgi:hypothetical protein
MRRDRKAEAHVHATRVALDRCVEHVLDARELHDPVELSHDLGPTHPQHRAAQEDVLTAGQLGMEAGPELEQAADPPPAAQRADRRARYPREDLQQRALACTVAADHADDVAAHDLEFDSAQRPELRRR